MSESLWDETTPAAVKKHKPRQPQPMGAVVPNTLVQHVKPTFAKREVPRDYAMEEAIRACAPILHPEEIEAHKEILNPALKIVPKIVDWRQRNGLA